MNIKRAELKKCAKNILAYKYWFLFVLAMISVVGSYAAVLLGLGLGAILFTAPFRAAYCNCIVVNSQNGEETDKGVLWKNFKDNYSMLLKNIFIRDLLLALWSLTFGIGMTFFALGILCIMAAAMSAVMTVFSPIMALFLFPFVQEIPSVSEAVSTDYMLAAFPLLAIGFVMTVVGVIIYYNKLYSYYMTDFIIGENPRMGWREAIKKSKKMMKKKRFYALKLDLSFIGWYAVVTLAVSFFWKLAGPFSIILLIIGNTMVSVYRDVTVAQMYLHLKQENEDYVIIDSEKENYYG